MTRRTPGHPDLRDLPLSRGSLDDLERLAREVGTRDKNTLCLFSGPSGTGKTLAAKALAAALKRPLQHLDLKAAVGKYIGETEKNLQRVFDTAQDAQAILFFDEADALFGKRTGVENSHDRYANLEVSHLLQRMEAYHGLIILTANQKSRIGAPFLRRLHHVIAFAKQVH